jgi:hypothetical protein
VATMVGRVAAVIAAAVVVASRIRLDAGGKSATRQSHTESRSPRETRLFFCHQLSSDYLSTPHG